MSDTMKWPDEITALRARVHQLLVERDHLERENAALRQDKERMDWLQKNEWYWNSKRRDLRKAIDAARKQNT